ncbi:methylcrotonoyl-CoA carboxylase subunit alpha, mitochondrial [Phlebotomus papatasi]|uniref:methylcrotonoyl-CoA carboxylase subunit alpha, mitochondrial n=1 Tax=Phlebotomus papatasi TaxID=29031 RepID=UPI002483AEC8|nr:methylcrotonoyl-CoA carboxylase subunit alpha, mitochondrial [Phlebotomus papatasi]
MLHLGQNLRRWFSTASQKIISQPINKILIANRGEIACRVVKTARRLGVQTVAVYSDADANSLHVQVADEAYHIGPPPSQQSYLRADKIIQVAKAARCQAIHPGYGFLSESVEFSDMCQQEGIIFMGPPASAIRDMGIKSTSKHIMAAAGVPIINGYHGEDQSDEKLIAEAQKIGFPLMIKAVRGGGGKGMRIAENESDFLTQLNSARTESEKAFGDSSMLLERFVRSPRHVEVQIFADRYGDAVYLFERDCSVQRRHQKIIEEAPAPGLSEQLRRELGEAAVRAAKAVGYVGAGTVEFILDKEDLSFHFMEMNTRLQVEHPITEMITGTDLVEWQIRIASGEPLPVTQEQIIRRGHAFEARIYAENPRGGFLPGAGPLDHLSTPTPDQNVRVETGVRQGDEVSVHYDPMIAKLVVWGENRTQALDSLIARLRDYHITGLETNVNFLLDLANHPSFRAADVHTGFIPQHFDTLFPPLIVSESSLIQAAVAVVVNELNAAVSNGAASGGASNQFNDANNFRLNHVAVREFQFKANDKVNTVQVTSSDGLLKIRVNDGEWRNVQWKCIPDANRFCLRCTIDGVFGNFSAVISPQEVAIFTDAGKTELEVIPPKFLSLAGEGGAAAHNQVVSPMPGVLDKVFVKAGDKVKAGDPLAVIIAMKMEHMLKAPKDAVVKSVGGQPGQNMAKGAVIVAFESEDKEDGQ